MYIYQLLNHLFFKNIHFLPEPFQFLFDFRISEPLNSKDLAVSTNWTASSQARFRLLKSMSISNNNSTKVSIISARSRENRVVPLRVLLETQRMSLIFTTTATTITTLITPSEVHMRSPRLATTKIQIISTVTLLLRIFSESSRQFHRLASTKEPEKAWSRGKSYLSRVAITIEIKRMRLKKVQSIQINMELSLKKVKALIVPNSNNSSNNKTSISSCSSRSTSNRSSPTRRRTPPSNGEKNPSTRKPTRQARSHLQTFSQRRKSGNENGWWCHILSRNPSVLSRKFSCSPSQLS